MHLADQIVYGEQKIEKHKYFRGLALLSEWVTESVMMVSFLFELTIN